MSTGNRSVPIPLEIEQNFFQFNLVNLYRSWEEQAGKHHNTYVTDPKYKDLLLQEKKNVFGITCDFIALEIQSWSPAPNPFEGLSQCH